MGHYRANFNMQSWSTVFHLLCVTWLSIRGVFWLYTLVSTQEWNNMTFHILYWLPNAFEFAAFAIIPMFFAQILYAETWRRYWSYIKPTYVLMIFTICILQIGWGIIAGLSTHCKGTLAGMDPVAINSAPQGVASASGDIEGHQQYHHTSSEYYDPSEEASQDTACMRLEYSAAASRFVAFILFFGLAVMQAIYGFHISNMPASTYKQYFNNNITFMNFVNSCLLFCFLSRAIYILCTLYGFRLLPAIPLQGHDDIHWSLFLFFEIWDYIPTTLLVLSVTSVPMGYRNVDPFRSFRSFTTLSSPQLKDTHHWDQSPSNHVGMRNSSNGTYGSIGSGLKNANSNTSVVFNQRERSSTEDMKRYNSGGDSSQKDPEFVNAHIKMNKNHNPMQISTNSQADNNDGTNWLSRLFFGYGSEDATGHGGYAVIDESNVMTLEIGSVSSTYTPSSSANMQPYRVFGQLSPTSGSITESLNNQMGISAFSNETYGQGAQQDLQQNKNAVEHQYQHQQQQYEHQYQQQYDQNSHSVAPLAGDTSYHTQNNKDTSNDASGIHSDTMKDEMPNRRQTLGVDANRNRDALELGNVANNSNRRQTYSTAYGEPTREEIARRFSLERFSAPESLDPPESWLSGSFRPNQILQNQSRNTTNSNTNTTVSTANVQDTFAPPSEAKQGEVTINTNLEVVGSIHNPSSWKGSRDISMFEEPSPGSSFTRKGMLDTLHHGNNKNSTSIVGGMTVAGVNIPPRVRAYSKDFSQSRGNMHIGSSNDISSSASNENRSHGSASSSTRDGRIENESTNIKENNINNGTVSAEEVSGNDTMPLASLSEGVQVEEGDGTEASGLGRLQQERTSIVQDRQMRRSRGNSIGSRL